MKKFLSLSLVIALLLTVSIIGIGTVATAAQASPESDFDAFDGMIEGYNGPGGDVVIPAEIDGVVTTEIAASAFYQNPDITSVVIPEGVKTIGNYAFAECPNLVEVQLPYSLRELGYASFRKSALESIRIPGNCKIVPHSCFAKNNLSKIEFSWGVQEIHPDAFNSNLVCDVVFPETVKLIAGFSFAFPNDTGAMNLTICNPNAKVGVYAETYDAANKGNWENKSIPISYQAVDANGTTNYIVPKDSAVGKFIEENFQQYLDGTAGTKADFSRNKQYVEYQSESYFEKLEQNKEDFGIVSAPEEDDKDTNNNNDDDEDTSNENGGSSNKNNSNKNNSNKNNGSNDETIIETMGISGPIIYILFGFIGIIFIGVIVVVILAATGVLGGKKKKSNDIDAETLARAMQLLKSQETAQTEQPAEAAEEQVTEEVVEETSSDESAE